MDALSILIIDDEQDLRQSFCAYFSDLGYQILFWLSVNRTFGLLVINHHKRRNVHAKEASQLHP
jgi:CheY-like chemotaxis protein